MTNPKEIDGCCPHEGRPYPLSDGFKCNHSCHTPTPSTPPASWSERFDAEISESAYYANGPTGISRDEIKAFIEKLLTEEREKVKKLTRKEDFYCPECMSDEVRDGECCYNDAIADVLSTLTPKK